MKDETWLQERETERPARTSRPADCAGGRSPGAATPARCRTLCFTCSTLCLMLCPAFGLPFGLPFGLWSGLSSGFPRPATPRAARLGPLPLLRHENRTAARRRATPAGILGLRIRSRVLFPLVRIVVEQLFAFEDRLPGIDEHPAPLDHGVAVRRTRVIDEARIVAAHGGVDHRPRSDREQERVMPGHRVVVVPAVRLGLRNALASVLPDTLPSLDPPGGEPPAALNPGPANLERRHGRQ
jgi:hypothetical protein